MPSGVASVYVVLVVVWTALADALIPGGHSRITLRVVTGLVIGSLGAVLLVGTSLRDLLSSDLRGPAMLTLASMSWGLGTVLMKRRRTDASPFTVAAMQMTAGGAVLVLLGLLVLAGFPLFRLPGDFTVRRGPVTFYFPLASSILLSILFTLLMLLFRR